MSRRISETSVQLIKKYSDQIGLTFPMDDDRSGYAILKFFESMDADIGGMKSEGKTVDDKLVADVDKIIEEFLYDGEDGIDYEDLERRLKS